MREYNFIENYRNYIKDISNRVDDYRISIAEFRRWLTENGKVEEFLKDITNPNDGLCDVAYDYGIPVSMVKYFRR